RRCSPLLHRCAAYRVLPSFPPRRSSDLLLGDPERIVQIAQANEVELPDGLQMIAPASVRQNYVAGMVELRKHKQLTEPMALATRSEEHTSELQSRENLVCRLLLDKNKGI